MTSVIIMTAISAVFHHAGGYMLGRAGLLRIVSIFSIKKSLYYIFSLKVCHFQVARRMSVAVESGWCQVCCKFAMFQNMLFI